MTHSSDKFLGIKKNPGQKSAAWAAVVSLWCDRGYMPNAGTGLFIFGQMLKKHNKKI